MKYGDVLEKILVHKKKLIEENKIKSPINVLDKSIEDNSAPDFLSIFNSSNVALIAEIKRSSASAGEINKDLDLEKFALDYITSGASAISILTEKTKFSGSISDLKKIGKIGKKTNTPILQKDFIVDEYQILEGALNGASAILIIVSILEEDRLKSLLNLCSEISMPPLVEVFNEKELNVALKYGANIIGINNRNLNNLETSLDVFEKLAPEVPKDKILIAESGLKNIDDVKRMANAGADAVLIGESILINNDIQNHIKQLSSVKKCK
jgi:indole-3-glycerol phosphate synthase